MKNKYVLIYWYPNESHIFSDPHVHFCATKQEYSDSLKLAKKSGYEVSCSGSLAMMRYALATAGMLKEG